MVFQTAHMSSVPVIVICPAPVPDKIPETKYSVLQIPVPGYHTRIQHRNCRSASIHPMCEVSPYHISHTLHNK